MYIGKKKSPLDVTTKRVPRNPKYANVKGYLDTGASMSKVRPVSTKEFLRRRSEIFERIRPSQVAEMLGPDLTLIDEEVKRDESKDGTEEENLLLLDLRAHEEYRACHIKNAVSFPIVCLHQDRLLPELYRFKNASGKLIVVYDEEEKFASEAAESLLQKGYENVRLMSGGLKVFGNRFLNCIVGEFPESWIRKKPSPTSSIRSSRRSYRNDSPRDGYSNYGDSVISSTHSIVSHRSSFSRAPRWKSDRKAAQHHKEILQKMHGHSPDCL